MAKKDKPPVKLTSPVKPPTSEAGITSTPDGPTQPIAPQHTEDQDQQKQSKKGLFIALAGVIVAAAGSIPDFGGNKLLANVLFFAGLLVVTYGIYVEYHPQYPTFAKRACITLALCILCLSGYLIFVALSVPNPSPTPAPTPYLEPQWEGYLRPGSKPTPPSKCEPKSPDSVGIYYGDAVGHTTLNPTNVITIGNETLLSLKRNGEGLAVTAYLYTEKGNEVAKIEDNKFTVNPNNLFNHQRPDAHTLIIYDPEGRLALKVEYLNLRAIKVLGVFRKPGFPPLSVEENEIRMGSNRYGRNCAWDAEYILGFS